MKTKKIKPKKIRRYQRCRSCHDFFGDQNRFFEGSTEILIFYLVKILFSSIHWRLQPMEYSVFGSRADSDPRSQCRRRKSSECFQNIRNTLRNVHSNSRVDTNSSQGTTARYRDCDAVWLNPVKNLRRCLVESDQLPRSKTLARYRVWSVGWKIRSHTINFMKKSM